MNIIAELQRMKAIRVASDWLNRNSLGLFALLISAVSLSASVRSCSVSQESNTIARQALDLSKRGFVYGNRPYLILSPRKDKDRNAYVSATPYPDRVDIYGHFEMKNQGQSPAVGIRLAHARLEMFLVSTVPGIASNLSVQAELPPQFTLGPGQDYGMTIGFSMNLDSNEASRVSQNVNSGKKCLPVTLDLEYKSSVDGSGYHTRHKSLLYANRAILVQAEME